jgi:hypothetical protein
MMRVIVVPLATLFLGCVIGFTAQARLAQASRDVGAATTPPMVRCSAALGKTELAAFRREMAALLDERLGAGRAGEAAPASGSPRPHP